MYRPLIAALWKVIDRKLSSELGIVPSKKRVNRRTFRLVNGPVSAYLVVEFSDFAGGRFNLLGALGRQAEPDANTTFSEHLKCPEKRTVNLVQGSVLTPGCKSLCVELDWQTPPKELILEAGRLDSGKELLLMLGVTEKDRHHLVNFELLETLGVEISETHYQSVVEKFRHSLHSEIACSIRPLVEILIKRAQECTFTPE